jgi:hypothetical protein
MEAPLEAIFCVRAHYTNGAGERGDDGHMVTISRPYISFKTYLSLLVAKSIKAQHIIFF